jgi:hypothetical protein
MASRSTIRASMIRMLGTTSDDPAYSSDVLNPIIQEAIYSLQADINIQNPSFNVMEATLVAASSTSHDYTFATQATPITNFARWLEVRWTDGDGLELSECRLEELRDAGPDFFTIMREGIETLGRLKTSTDSDAGTDVWMRYTLWEAEMSSDSDVPESIPLQFHDVIALEGLYVFGLGGEDRTPPELYNRWMDRRNQLMHYVGKRGVQPSRSRIYVDTFE